MNIFFVSVIVILLILLIYCFRRNFAVQNEKEQLIKVRDTALFIANKVLETNYSTDLYQYILESCMKLIPKAKFGSILMFDEDGLLMAKASVGFNEDEIAAFRLKLEESFLYIATKGRLDKTVIINRLEDIVLPKNIVQSGDRGFALRSEVSSPLHINNELVGMLCIDGDKNDIFSEQDIYVLDYMSNQISIVISNQKLYGDVLHLSRHDSLTDLLNRNSFEQEATILLEDPSLDAFKRYFVLVDLDGLKAANDNFGHHFGDQMLINFSRIIKDHLNARDICGRYGGDEFAAIFHGDSYEIGNTLEKIKNEFMASVKTGPISSFTPDFSYGLASFTEGHCDLDTLYKLADSRMYDIKNKKKKERH